jgi:hypothetical protein
MRPPDFARLKSAVPFLDYRMGSEVLGCELLFVDVTVYIYARAPKLQISIKQRLPVCSETGIRGGTWVKICAEQAEATPTRWLPRP